MAPTHASSRWVLACVLATGLGCGRPPQEITLEIETHGVPADVYVNGKRVGSAPYRWRVYPRGELDSGVVAEQWPPANSRGAGGMIHQDDLGITVDALEVYVADSVNGTAGEYVVYVRGVFNRTLVLDGAVRVKVLGPEGEPFRFRQGGSAEGTPSRQHQSLVFVEF